MATPRKIPDDIWRRMTNTEKLMALWAMNLDNVHDLVSIPFADADLHERALQVRIHEIGMKFIGRLADDERRNQGRQEMLDNLKELLEKGS